MSDGDIIHPISEFCNFPWHKINKEMRNCGFGKFGSDRRYSSLFSFISEDLTAEYWEIPEQLQQIIDLYRNFGKEEARLAMRTALGITSY